MGLFEAGEWLLASCRHCARKHKGQERVWWLVPNVPQTVTPTAHQTSAATKWPVHYVERLWNHLLAPPLGHCVDCSGSGVHHNSAEKIGLKADLRLRKMT